MCVVCGDDLRQCSGLCCIYLAALGYVDRLLFRTVAGSSLGVTVDFVRLLLKQAVL